MKNVKLKYCYVMEEEEVEEKEIKMGKQEQLRFDLIIVSRFHNKELLPDIGRTLAPGGYLLYHTFMMECARPVKEELKLKPGYLSSLAVFFVYLLTYLLTACYRMMIMVMMTMTIERHYILLLHMSINHIIFVVGFLMFFYVIVKKRRSLGRIGS